MITRYVDTASSGGNGTTTATSGSNAAYSSITDFWSELHAISTLTDDYECICTGGEDTISTQNYAYFADGGYSVTVKAASGDEHNGDPATTGYRINYTGNGSLIVHSGGVVVTYQDIYFHASFAGSASISLVRLFGAGVVTIDRCMFERTGGVLAEGSAALRANDNDSQFFVRNSLFFGPWDWYGRTGGAGVSHYVYNSTMVGSLDRAFYNNGNKKWVVKNCVVEAATATGENSGFGTGSDYNVISDANTSLGANSATNTTLTFTDSAGEDWTLAAGDTDAIGQGTDLSADGNLTVAVDIAGNARSAPFDIGAFSYSAGDVTAPTLSSATSLATGQSTATGTVSTDEANGTLDAVVTTSATTPSAVQIQSGLDHVGSAAEATDLNNTVSATGVQNVSFTGLDASTTYYIHYVHEDAVGNVSTAVSSASFITAALGTLSGTVTLNASPVSGALVYLIDQGTDTVVSTDTTDASGNYSFTGLAAGTYHAVVESSSGTAPSVPDLVVS